jgi:hypothetical protein
MPLINNDDVGRRIAYIGKFLAIGGAALAILVALALATTVALLR